MWGHNFYGVLSASCLKKFWHGNPLSGWRILCTTFRGVKPPFHYQLREGCKMHHPKCCKDAACARPVSSWCLSIGKYFIECKMHFAFLLGPCNHAEITFFSKEDVSAEQVQSWTCWKRSAFTFVSWCVRITTSSRCSGSDCLWFLAAVQSQNSVCCQTETYFVLCWWCLQLVISSAF